MKTFLFSLYVLGFFLLTGPAHAQWEAAVGDIREEIKAVRATLLEIQELEKNIKAELDKAYIRIRKR